MIGLYICQPIAYSTNRLTPTRMLWMQVYESVYMTFFGAPVIPSSNFWSISDFLVWVVMIAV
jgi:hypothetical protein